MKPLRPRVALAYGDKELRRRPGCWAGRRNKPVNQTQALEGWSPAVLAWAIDQRLVDPTPMTLTPRGVRWLKAGRKLPWPDYNSHEEGDALVMSRAE